MVAGGSGELAIAKSGQREIGETVVKRRWAFRALLLYSTTWNSTVGTPGVVRLRSPINFVRVRKRRLTSPKVRHAKVGTSIVPTSLFARQSRNICVSVRP